MTPQEEKVMQVAKKRVLLFVRKCLKHRTPAGYSFVIPDDGVMYVSDGVSKQHERWYVVVRPEPESVAERRAVEIQRILSEAERELTEKHRLTVYLMSALPVV